MKNPWLNIPSKDYEEHMDQVGQSRMLSNITSEVLRKGPDVKKGAKYYA